MSFRSNRLPARLTIILVSLFLLLLAIHFAGIALTRYLVEKTLHPALPKGTYIGEVHLNMMTGLLEIEDFRLRRDNQLWIRAGKATVDISPWQLFIGRVHIEDIDIQNAYLRVSRQPDGSFDMGLPPFGTDEPSVEDAEPFPLNLGGAAVERFAVEYHDDDFVSILYVDSLDVGAFSLASDSQDTPVSWRMHWDKRLLAGEADIAINGAQISVDGRLQTDPIDLVRVQRLARLPEVAVGELAYEGSFAWQSPQLTLNGALQSPSLGYSADGQEVSLSEFELPAFDLTLLIEPAIDVDLALTQPLRIGALNWQSPKQVAEAQELTLRSRLGVRIDGDLELAETALAAERLAWFEKRDGGRTIRLSALTLDGDAQQSLVDGLPRLAVQAAVGALAYLDEGAGLSVEVDGVELDELRLASVDDEQEARALSGQLSLAKSRLDDGQTQVDWESAALQVGGRLSDANLVNGEISVEALQVSHPTLVEPLSLRQVSAKGFELSEQSRLQKLRLDGLVLPSTSTETSLRVDSIELGSVLYSEARGVVIDEIVIDSLQTGVIRDKAGEWRHPMSEPTDDKSKTPEDAAPTAAVEQTDKTAKQPTAEDAMPWSIGGVRVTGDSHITAADYLNPDMSKPRFQIERLSLGALSSSAPNDDTPFEVRLRPDEFAEFVIDGKVRPLAEDFYIKAKGHLHGFGLTTINGLIANDLGHRFLEGQLDNDFDISIESNRLSMSNALSLASVDVEGIEGKDGPPLGTAIALLEDRDGNIKLQVPVDGDLEDPDFRVLGALNPIIMKAVAGTAALAIQPLGSVLLVGSLLADKALKVTFEPAVFESGTAELDSKASDYLGQLAAKLVEKPKLAVRLCGVTVESERKKDKQGAYLDKEPELLQLAQRRADAARTYLQTQGVGEKQLRNCRPALDDGVDSKPRVDIKF